ncbi:MULTISPECIES: GNAT family N-acetyltransferase [unclassified Sporosarcina]|uniref:GNAT family N-acetyltransferase n=1 Tax=unclassified Sporosarcina TaxID=2647733 RepID=UPI000C16A6EF|nr:MULTISPECIES: GNAT family N-acetyltransferase [unclassified Sporosarcina]PIC98331.1 GNAT family N-acetyltransferase [Sporosarcina sp. P29]PID05966.1 GNAT family N-acetyltransferase [Sporosarcina sp. P30]PID09160.1 GNAT family N-acetyltransferase [Sporosarcina sp. P31]PID12458.1 GNAT family N-acetyltransferase [Sporosarcina sp. P32b]
MNFKRIRTEEDLQKSFNIRKAVFVEEQQVPEEDEFDEFDVLNELCEHIVVEDEGQAIASGRVRVVDGVGKLERICVLASHRSAGIGKIIVQGLEEIAMDKGLARLKLHGQTHAEEFYLKLGYKTTSDVFMEDGIPHIVMEKKLAL